MSRELLDGLRAFDTDSIDSGPLPNGLFRADLGKTNEFLTNEFLKAYMTEQAKLQPFANAQNDALRKLERLRKHDGKVWDLLRRRMARESRMAS